MASRQLLCELSLLRTDDNHQWLSSKSETQTKRKKKITEIVTIFCAKKREKEYRVSPPLEEKFRTIPDLSSLFAAEMYRGFVSLCMKCTELLIEIGISENLASTPPSPPTDL